MPKLYIHTGTPKTGTTSFQYFLKRNTRELGALGLNTVDVGVPDRGGHHGVVIALFGIDEAPRWRKVEDAFWAELESDGERDAIISTEGFTTRGLNRPGGAERMQEIAARAAGLGYETTFLTCVRDYVSIFESSYSQRAKTFQAMKGFQAELREGNHRQSYIHQHLEPVRRTGLPAIFVPFDSALRARGTERALLERIGVPIETLTMPERTNERAGIVEVAAALALTQRHLAGTEINTAQGVQCNAAVLDECARRLETDPAYKPMTVVDAALLRHRFQAEADAFARSVWSKSWSAIFGDDADDRLPQTIEVNDAPSRYLRIAREVAAAAEPRVLRVIADQSFRRTFSQTRVVAPRKDLAGCDLPPP